jgi:hypothetical protein
MAKTIRYVPILRWKQAEKLALRHLHNEDRDRITPLIEITPKSFDPPKAGKNEGKRPDPRLVLEDHVKELLEDWQYAPFFLDFCLIDGLIPLIGGVRHPLVYLAEIAQLYKLHMVPVIGLKRRDEYKSAVSRVFQMDGRGICLRVLAKEIPQSAFAQRVKAILNRLGLDESKVDLFLDYQAIDPQEPDLRTILTNIPRLGEWRSLTVASGAFPMDLQGCKLGSNLIPRTDWLNWKRQALDGADSGARWSRFRN